MSNEAARNALRKRWRVERHDNEDGSIEWTGEWVRDGEGNTVNDCCHYFLHAGVLKFCGDSLHSLAGKDVPLPDLPPHMRDATWVYD